MVPGLFTTPIFTELIMPRLLQIFCVHDAQIRMILLEHFHKFMGYFAETDLRTVVLPQLLLGIKDTNDHLVAMTLRCLADLVPILGAAVVIGKNRNRIFSDGRPQRHPIDVAAATAAGLRHWPEQRSITPLIESAGGDQAPMDRRLSSMCAEDVSHENLMPVRLAPDGGEDLALSDKNDEDEEWSDWENDNGVTVDPDQATATTSNVIIEQEVLVESTASRTAGSWQIDDLDIKVQKGKEKADEVDFFKDMEPVIVKSSSLPPLQLPTQVAERLSPEPSNRLAIQTAADPSDETGWGDSDWEGN